MGNKGVWEGSERTVEERSPMREDSREVETGCLKRF